jgi:hexosaminidase
MHRKSITSGGSAVSTSPVIGWNRQDLPKPLHAPLAALGEYYPLACDRPTAALQLRCTHDPALQGLRLTRTGEVADLTYGQPHHALRGVSALLGGLVRPGQTCEAHLPFETLGIMLDCSRNAVMTVDHVKVWLRRLALLGYNMVMLYTEDTYELPDEPYFGYQRGAYTAQGTQGHRRLRSQAEHRSDSLYPDARPP